MSTSDWLLLAFNMLALMMAVVGLATQHLEPMSIGLSLGMMSILLGSARILRRGTPATRAPASEQTSLPEAELDARRILDIDARLDALERAEERRLQMLAVEGVVTAPAAEAEPASGTLHGRQRIG
ncbi:MAG: hypothetical protein AAF845_18585 [Bacteroidota bacterium]